MHMYQGPRLLERIIAAVVRHFGYQLVGSVIANPPDDALFLSMVATSPNRQFTVAVIGTSKEGLGGYGKATPAYYFPSFAYALAKRGVSLIAYRNPADALRDLKNYNPDQTAFILVYNEVFQRELLPSFVALTSSTNLRFYNAPHIGKIIGDKRATNSLFSKAGIPVPVMIDTTTASSKVFSNARFGSHDTTAIIGIGKPLDTNRHNTKFIDTTSEYRGRSYYVALRTLAITGTMISAYVRLRPTDEAEVSVHAGDTPKDPDLISYFQKVLVDANWHRLIQLCEKIGDVLGFGFYAHDILPCRETGELYVCETGFKFDDEDFRVALWPISSDLPFLIDHFTSGIADLAADAVVGQCFGRILSNGAALADTGHIGKD
jgi:hypothetical protein